MTFSDCTQCVKLSSRVHARSVFKNNVICEEGPKFIKNCYWLQTHWWWTFLSCEVVFLPRREWALSNKLNECVFYWLWIAKRPYRVHRISHKICTKCWKMSLRAVQTGLFSSSGAYFLTELIFIKCWSRRWPHIPPKHNKTYNKTCNYKFLNM